MFFDYTFLIWIVFIIFIFGVRRQRFRSFIRIREQRERRIEYVIVDEPPNENDDCCICLVRLSELDLEIADKIIKTDCNHYYHKSCLINWINSDNELRLNCPLCLGEL